MKYFYKPKGVCSTQIELEMDKEIIKSIIFTGGCHGNLQGISAMCKNQNAHNVINILQGINCNRKTTSCPDQLTKALSEYLIENNLN